MPNHPYALAAYVEKCPRRKPRSRPVVEPTAHTSTGTLQMCEDLARLGKLAVYTAFSDRDFLSWRCRGR
jgi:hypothetical protein